MNSSEETDAIYFLNSLSVFKNGAAIELPAKQLAELTRDKLHLITLLKKLDIVSVSPFIKSIREEVPPPFMFVTKSEEWVRVVINEPLFSDFKDRYDTHLVTCNYDPAVQQLEIRAHQTILGKIKFNNSGVWFDAVEHIGKKIQVNNHSKAKSIRAQLSNHPRFSVLKHITRFDNAAKTIMVKPRSIISNSAYKEIKEAFTK